MGIVAKQTIKGSLYSYIGILIGGINIALLYPRIFAEEQVGLINVLLAISSLAAPFASLGINGSTNYFFAWFKDKDKKHNGFFLFMLLVSLVGFLLFTIIYYFFSDTILATKVEKSELITNHSFYIIPLTLFTLAFSVMDVYSSVLHDSVLGTILQEFLFRIINSALIIFYFFHWISFDGFLFWYTVALALPPLAIGVILMKRGEIFWNLPKGALLKRHRKQIFYVSLFYVVSGFGSLMVTYIDRYMVNYFIGLRAAGIYAITNYFGSIVEVPRRSMSKISTPLIADAWKKNDRLVLQSFYMKSSLTQVLFGLLIFIGIWVNVDSIFVILPKNYQDGREVIFWTGLSVIFNCFFGVGAQILLTSTKYKAYTFLTLFLGVLVIGTNLLFIPWLGITGAAIASAISKFIFSALVIWVLKYNFNIQPFTKDLLYVVLASIVAYYLGYFVPSTSHLVLNIAIKSLVVAVSYLSILYFLGVFKEYEEFFNQFATSVWKKD